MTNKSEYPLVFKGVLVETDGFGDFSINGAVTKSKDIFGDCPIFRGTWYNYDITDYCVNCKFYGKDLDKEFRAKAIAALIEVHDDYLKLRQKPEPMNIQAYRHCFE